MIETMSIVTFTEWPNSLPLLQLLFFLVFKEIKGEMLSTELELGKYCTRQGISYGSGVFLHSSLALSV